MTPRLASRFSRQRVGFRSHQPLSDDQIRQYAPSIFAEEKHGSRSTRYTCIPTIDVVQALRREGFEPFEVAQTKVRDEGKREHAKHMLRLRHADQVNAAEANEIILLNSHDGTSIYQMLAGVFRFACANGMVCGDVVEDLRIPHRGDVVGEVVNGAFRVLDQFGQVVESREEMKGLQLNQEEQAIFARAALSLKYDTETAAAPVTEDQVLSTRRLDDRGGDLWRTFNRVQENLIRGGLDARTTTGKRTRTRPVQGIDTNVKLNRALWTLAEEMRRLKG
jgi:hypothetical protein